jgi:hypothetical protein
MMTSNNNNNNNNNLFNIDSLSPYMLNLKNLNKIIQNGASYDNIRKVTTKQRHNTHVNLEANKEESSSTSSSSSQGSTFFPDVHDSLFWSFYIMKNSQEAYESLGKINIVIERKIKIEYIERFRESKQVLKTYKSAPLTHLENVLLNEKQIDIKTLIALCVIEGISCMYIYKNTYFEMNNDADESSTQINAIVRMDMPTKYGYKIIPDAKPIRESFYKIDNMHKPLKSMSAYKLDELVVFCNKLGMSLGNDGKKVNKKSLYEMLVQYFVL